MDTAVSSTKKIPVNDPVFDQLIHSQQNRLAACLQDVSNVLFTTDADGLFDAYLNAFPDSGRQHFNCHACKQFMESYASLVAIGEDGTLSSPFWQIDAAGVYAEPFAALRKKVLAAKITGVYYSSATVLGTPESNGWTHLAVQLPKAYGTRHLTTLTAHQAQAAKLEDFRTVMHALVEFSQDDLAQAVRVLSADALYRSEHLLGAAEWLAKMQDIRRTTKNHRTREALLWRAIALAPAGFCHPRAGMLGTLLEDIQVRLPFETIKQRFDAKMHPLRYQRPTAAPSVGTIAQAEKLVQQMGIESSLKRRFARLDEIEALWRPALPAPAPDRAGVFAHLTPKGADTSSDFSLNLPARIMTWEKFQRAVLPDADAIEFMAPTGVAHYVFLTTAVDPEAPPILQWDHQDHRNPVAWYVYHGGIFSSRAGLNPGYCKVTAVTLQPTAWGESRITHHGESAIFCLDGCRDTDAQSMCIFPECLQSELHGIRSVIEAFSRSGRLEEPDGPLANGIRLQKGLTGYGQFRVTSKGQTSVYLLDRWD